MQWFSIFFWGGDGILLVSKGFSSGFYICFQGLACFLVESGGVCGGYLWVFIVFWAVLVVFYSFHNGFPEFSQWFLCLVASRCAAKEFSDGSSVIFSGFPMVLLVILFKGFS